MMDWIKVTPETMPPDMEPVMVTVKRAGKKKVLSNYRYLKEYEAWQFQDKMFEEWTPMNSVFRGMTVTHWKPMPSPAED